MNKKLLILLTFCVAVSSWSQITLVEDINIGVGSSSPKLLFELNNRMYFVANNSAGNTAVHYMDINEIVIQLGGDFPNYLINDMIGYQGDIYFTLRYFGPNNLIDRQPRLYRMNATTGQTEFLPLGEFVPGPILAVFSNFFIFNNELYFGGQRNPSGNAEDANDIELFAYNGVTLRQVDDEVTNNPNSNGNGSLDPENFTVHNGELFFRGNITETTWGIYKSNGVTVTLVYDMGLIQPFDFISFNNLLYFSGATTAGSSDPFLYSLNTNNTNSTPSVVSSYYYRGAGMSILDGKLMFSGSLQQIGNPNLEIGLIGIDTAGITREIPKQGESANINVLIYSKILDGAAYFFGRTDAIGSEMFRLVPGGSLELIQDYNSGTGSSSPLEFESFNGKIYYSANNGTLGSELHVLDPNQIQQTTFPIDSSFESYLISEGIDSNPTPNGVISFVDAAKTTNIRFELNNLDIQNLNGIENFTFLEEIFINGGSLNLTTLNFSQNKLLKQINTNIPNLSSLIVNGADALENIRVGPTQLISLDVSQNQELKNLSIYGSQITTIDVTANTKLESFVLDNTTTLTSDMNFSNNNALNTVVILNSTLTDLNLVNRPNLSYVDVTGSSITNMALQELPALTSSLFLNNSEIVNLTIDNTVLQGLDVSLVNNLEILDVRYNSLLTNLSLPPTNSPLRELTIFASIANDNNPATAFNYTISDRINLEKLEIWQSGITNLTIEDCTNLDDLIIGEHISGITELQNITIKNTALVDFNLGNNNSELLNIEIENNPFLTEISTGDNGLSSVERLSVVENNLGLLDVSRLTNIETLSVRQNPNLTTLDLTTINNGAPNSLITFEGENTSISALDFSTSPNIERILLSYNSNLGGSPLSNLNLKNGNNSAISELNTQGNYPSLSCIEVDSNIVGTSSTDWFIDSQTILSENCNAVAPVLVSFILPNEENLEDTGTPTPRLLLEGTLTTPATISLLTSTFAGNNIADPATDYSLTGGSSIEVQIPAGTYDTMTSFLVPGLSITNDNDYEGNEVLYLEAFSNATELVNAADNVPLSQGSLIYSYTILEDDYRVDISAGSSIQENGASSNFNISLLDNNGVIVNNNSGRDIQVLFSSIGDAMENVDFNLIGEINNGAITIQNGLGVATITLDPIDDNLYEDGEFIDLELNAGTGYYLDTNIGNLSNGFSILDNDDKISFTSSRAGIEGGLDTEFTISLSDENGNPAINDTGFEIEFDISLSSGTGVNAAALNIDFVDGIKNNSNSIITLGTSQEFVTFEVSVIDDTTSESQENFISTIAIVDLGLGLGLDLNNNQAIGLINDNDGGTAMPTIQWGTVTSTIEGETVNQPVVLINGEVPTGGLDLSFGLVTGGTAQATPAASPQNELDDFIFVSGGTAPVSYAFGIGEGSYDGSNPVTYQLLTIYEDDRYEGNETLRIEIQTNELTIIGNPILEYTIIDDDYRIELNSGGDFNENGGSSNFSFTLADENGNPVNNESGQDIQIEWLDIENAQQGSDYSLSGNGVIENGQQSTTIEINGIDDNLFEGQEFAGLELQEGQGYFVDINTLPRTSLAINDNDNNIVFSASQIGLEDAQDVGFTLALEDVNGNAATNSTVNSLGFDIVLTSGNGANSAILGTDFANGLKDIVGNSVFIEPGQSSTTFEVVVIDDQDDENRENFLVNISTPETEVILANTQVTAFIDDNDGQDEDSDNDGISDTSDNCPNTSNTNQADLDNDGIGDVCDPDIDGDGVANADDAFPRDPNESSDTDGDGVGDNGDNCPNNGNADQADTDGDGIGDVCETAGNDADNDGVLDTTDNCPNLANVDQADLDNDGLGDVCDPDIDGDGILNDNDDCPEIAGTPENNGCPNEDNAIDQEDIQVLVLSETCPDENNGSFRVSIQNEEYTFNVLLDGTSVGTANFANEFERGGLADGEYQVCLTVDQLPNFEQCFGISIRTFERLSADAMAVDPVNLKASFMVGGSTTYEVLVNDVIFTFEMPDTKQQHIQVPVEKGKNSIAISGKSDCQGIFTDVIQIGDVSIYPNPLVDILNFEGLTSQGNAQVMVHTVSGQLIVQASMELNSGMADINLSQLPKGVYLIRMVTLEENIEFKIIKK